MRVTLAGAGATSHRHFNRLALLDLDQARADRLSVSWRRIGYCWGRVLALTTRSTMVSWLDGSRDAVITFLTCGLKMVEIARLGQSFGTDARI
jgi:hypothetical protein